MSNREVFVASRKQRKVEWAKVAGKWTRREELYAGQLIKNFINGTLSDCQEGCTLRAYLARKLECAPMRISKKFSGQNLGKLTYNSNRSSATSSSAAAAYLAANSGPVSYAMQGIQSASSRVGSSNFQGAAVATPHQPSLVSSIPQIFNYQPLFTQGVMATTDSAVPAKGAANEAYNSSPLADQLNNGIGSPPRSLSPESLSDREIFMRIADNLITPRESMFSSQRSSRSSGNINDIRLSFGEGNFSGIDLLLGPDAMASTENINRLRIDSQENVIIGVAPEDAVANDVRLTTFAAASSRGTNSIVSGAGLSMSSASNSKSVSSNKSISSISMSTVATVNTGSSNAHTIGGRESDRISTLSSVNAVSFCSGISGINNSSTRSTMSDKFNPSIESFDHFLANHGPLVDGLDVGDRGSFQVQDRDYSIISTNSLNDIEALIQDTMGMQALDEQMLPEEIYPNPENYDSDDSEQSELNLAI